jgi:uncharacterized protein DUF1918
MRAHIGDRLVPDGHHGRVAVVIGVRNPDSSPPYVVKWLPDGHIALFYPGPYTRVLPGEPADRASRAGQPAAPGSGLLPP